MKPSHALLFLALLLGAAAYFRSWWLVVIAFFVLTVQIFAQAFMDIKKHLDQIDRQLTRIEVDVAAMRNPDPLKKLRNDMAEIRATEE